MSAARILHFGDDECHRLAVLKQAGYETNLCSSEPELVEQVQVVAPAAVLFSRIPAKPHDIQELRNRTKIPFVAFGGSTKTAKAESFDLVIEPVTTPDVWLEQFSDIILRSRQVLKNSELIRKHSRQLRGDSESLRRECEAVRRELADTQQKLTDTWRKFDRRKP